MSSLNPTDHPEFSPILEEITDVCVETLVLRGYDRCSLKDLAEACGEHGGFVEEHFKTKQDLCAELLHWYLYRIFTELKSSASLHSNLYSALEGVFYEYIDITVDNRERGRAAKFNVLEDLVAFDPELAARFHEYYQEGLNHLALKFASLAGDLKDPNDALRLMNFCVMVIEGLYVLVRRDFDRESLRQYADVGMAGISTYLK